MRRYFFFLIFTFGISLAAVSAWAQNSPPKQDGPLYVAELPGPMITGTQTWQPVELELTPLGEHLTPDIIYSTNQASDTCSAAVELTIPGGDSTDVNAMTTEASDPLLSCRWGGPAQGYRTAWYQFTAPFNGYVRIDTYNSSYDTILAVYPGDCNNLVALACNDDMNGFASKVTLTVRKGEIYYVEVADWEAGAATTKSLRITAVMEPFTSLWQQTSLMPQSRSRHAAAVAGKNIYVIGGQTVLGGVPTIVNRFERYKTDTNQWVTLPSMPGVGYSNTTAAYVDVPNDNKSYIYLPSGYTGGSDYDMTHWRFDIQGNSWSESDSILDDIPGTIPFGWAAAVAVQSPQPGYYLTGGLEGTVPFSTTASVRDGLLLYLPVSDAWLLKETDPAPTPRYAHMAALVNNRICVVGGISSGNILLVDGECYTPSANTWATIAAMNFPRYAAGSGVDASGNWYVYGGIDANGNAVSETEVYDPRTDTWTVLDVQHDLGGTQNWPARAWPRGGVVGNRLWSIGGNDMPAQTALGFVENLFTPTDTTLLPIIFSNFGGAASSDDHFGVARRLTLNVPQFRNFDNINDYFDVYYFELASLTTVTTKLTQVPANSDYNIAIYDANKLLWGKGENLQGLNESVTLTLNPGRYYVMVERVWPFGDPNTANYRIIVEK